MTISASIGDMKQPGLSGYGGWVGGWVGVWVSELRAVMYQARSCTTRAQAAW